MIRRTILVVDDDENVRNMLCTVLAAEGFHAIGAFDGLDALQQLRRDGPPALILVDLMMPRMNGEGLIRAIHQDPLMAGIPVVVVSGQQQVRDPSMLPRVDACLNKPIELDELLALAYRFAS
jgi:two-component system, chemotaxis family, chemotaxis protein CheY